MRRMQFVIAAVTALCTVTGGVAAYGAATAPTGGKIEGFLTPSGNGSGGPIVFAGAIGDYGRTHGTKPNGNSTVTLQKGDFTVNLKALDTKVNNAPPTLVNNSTCSFAFSGSGPVTIVPGSGTGKYAGISGTLKVTETFVGVGTRYKSGPKKGKCNESNNAPVLKSAGGVIITGSVSF